MVVVRPTEAQCVLAGLLEAGRTVAGGPVLPLGRKEHVGRAMHSKFGNRGGNLLAGLGKALLDIRENPLPPRKRLGMAQQEIDRRPRHVGQLPAAIPVAFNGPKLGSVLSRDPSSTQGLERPALDRRVPFGPRQPGEPLGGNEVGHRLHADR